MERIQVALIGAGRMGQVHGGHAARHPGLHLSHIVDARPGVADPPTDTTADLAGAHARAPRKGTRP